MGVEPGFSGQTFNPKTLMLIKTMTSIAKEHSLQIAIDGGVNPNSLTHLKDHAIDHAVLGSALFNQKSIVENLNHCEQVVQGNTILDPQS